MNKNETEEGKRKPKTRKHNEEIVLQSEAQTVRAKVQEEDEDAIIMEVDGQRTDFYSDEEGEITENLNETMDEEEEELEEQSINNNATLVTQERVQDREDASQTRSDKDKDPGAVHKGQVSAGDEAQSQMGEYSGGKGRSTGNNEMVTEDEEEAFFDRFTKYMEKKGFLANSEKSKGAKKDKDKGENKINTEKKKNGHDILHNEKTDRGKHNEKGEANTHGAQSNNDSRAREVDVNRQFNQISLSPSETTIYVAAVKRCEEASNLNKMIIENIERIHNRASTSSEEDPLNSSDEPFVEINDNGQLEIVGEHWSRGTRDDDRTHGQEEKHHHQGPMRQPLKREVSNYSGMQNKPRPGSSKWQVKTLLKK